MPSANPTVARRSDIVRNIELLFVCVCVGFENGGTCGVNAKACSGCIYPWDEIELVDIAFRAILAIDRC